MLGVVGSVKRELICIFLGPYVGGFWECIGVKWKIEFLKLLWSPIALFPKFFARMGLGVACCARGTGFTACVRATAESKNGVFQCFLQENDCKKKTQRKAFFAKSRFLGGQLRHSARFHARRRFFAERFGLPTLFVQ